MNPSLLDSSEEYPFVHEFQTSNSAFVLVCEHGGAKIPKSLNNLGLTAFDLKQHYSWDINALPLARKLAIELEASLLHQPYSRLICDCNRHPGVSSYIAEEGEGHPIPGNIGLTKSQRTQRTDAIWRPFHENIAKVLDHRKAIGKPTVLISIHSFTPVFWGVKRPWHVGVLYDKEDTLSPTLYEVLFQKYKEVVGKNQPYEMNKETDYTIPVHGENRHLPCVEIEVRNDLIRTDPHLTEWAMRLKQAIEEACSIAGITEGMNRKEKLQ